ncbi:MAG: phytanoyl-CoA dioxygenase family protein [Planctomycetes bacterium]|nr:phytanoyl-CoA dioxygenase family protein [Planctomycetota bacterium]
MTTAAGVERRVFAFHPASDRPAKRLTANQRRSFDERGIVDRIRVFDATEIADIRSRIDRLLQVFKQAGKDSYSIDGYQTSCATIYDIVREPRLLDFVEDLLGPDFVCWGTHCFCKMPGDGKTVSWHQDAPFWPLSPTRTVTVWLAIDDVDAENGAMQVIPGSHRHGAIPISASKPEENNVLWLTTEGYESYGSAEHVQLTAGEVSIHSDLLLHGSERNHSPRRRCGMAIRYATVDVRTTSDWRPKSIHCRGTDPAGYWPDHPRPEADAPAGLPAPSGELSSVRSPATSQRSE